ncbi:MAG: nucleotidyltransferase domain-containing protein [Natronosporangium sp.]
MNRLADHGLVSVQEAGNARLYALNRDHIAAPVVLAMTGLRGALFARIRTQLASWRVPPVSALVFGSTARGDGDVESDVDVFLVRPDDVDADAPGWRAQVSELSRAITRWTGNRASMIEVSVAEARAMHERDDPVAIELARDAVPMTGVPIGDVFSGQSR